MDLEGFIKHGQDESAYVQFNHDEYSINPNKYLIKGIEAVKYISEHSLVLNRKSKIMNNANRKGLKQKYIIHKSNGKQVDTDAEFFVLRLDKKGEVNHVNACLKALAVYTENIKPYLPELAKDLEDKYNLNQ